MIQIAINLFDAQEQPDYDRLHKLLEADLIFGLSCHYY